MKIRYNGEKFSYEIEKYRTARRNFETYILPGEVYEVVEFRLGGYGMSDKAFINTHWDMEIEVSLHDPDCWTCFGGSYWEVVNEVSL